MSKKLRLKVSCIQKIKKTVADDEKLTAQIKELCQKMNEKVKKFK